MYIGSMHAIKEAKYGNSHLLNSFIFESNDDIGVEDGRHFALELLGRWRSGCGRRTLCSDHVTPHDGWTFLSKSWNL